MKRTFFGSLHITCFRLRWKLRCNWRNHIHFQTIFLTFVLIACQSTFQPRIRQRIVHFHWRKFIAALCARAREINYDFLWRSGFRFMATNVLWPLAVNNWIIFIVKTPNILTKITQTEYNLIFSVIFFTFPNRIKGSPNENSLFVVR